MLVRSEIGIFPEINSAWHFGCCCAVSGQESLVEFVGGALKIGRHVRFAALIPFLLIPGHAAAQDALGDPQGSGVIVSAVRWLQGTLLGTVATVVAVIAVASVGLLMLTGRINWRYGATVIVGCFILFGAASIVAGIQSAATLGN